jgi:hypothetical protein
MFVELCIVKINNVIIHLMYTIVLIKKIINLNVEQNKANKNIVNIVNNNNKKMRKINEFKNK